MVFFFIGTYSELESIIIRETTQVFLKGNTVSVTIQFSIELEIINKIAYAYKRMNPYKLYLNISQHTLI